jgi:hypothetical protein
MLFCEDSKKAQPENSLHPYGKILMLLGMSELHRRTSVIEAMKKMSVGKSNLF